VPCTVVETPPSGTASRPPVLAGKREPRRVRALGSPPCNELNLRTEELFLTQFLIYDLVDFPGDLFDSQSRKLSGLRLF
jgi:hypothetical protein